MNADGIQIPRSKLPGPASAPARLGASWKYDRGRSRAGNVGQASRLPCRAVRRGFRTTKASLRSAGQARRLPYVGGTDKMRPARLGKLDARQRVSSCRDELPPGPNWLVAPQY